MARVTAETLTDEMIESEMRIAGSALAWNPLDFDAWDHMEDCRIAAEGCASLSFKEAQQRVCDRINARHASKEHDRG